MYMKCKFISALAHIRVAMPNLTAEHTGEVAGEVTNVIALKNRKRCKRRVIDTFFVVQLSILHFETVRP